MKDENTKISVMLCDLGRSFRGGQRQTLNLANGLIDKDIEVILACPYESSLWKRAEEACIKLIEADYGLVSIFQTVLRLANRIEESGTKIFHASDSHSHTLGILIKRMTPKLKLTVTARTCFASSGWISRRFKYGTYAVDKYVAISNSVKDNLLSRGAAKDRIEVIPSSVDRNLFSSDSRTSNEVFTIGTACALDKDKGVDQIIRALAKFNERKKHWKFLIAGEGDKRDELEELSQSLGLAVYISFLGFVEDMPNFYRKLDVYILASRMEGLGSSLIEAAACGALPVGTDVGGVGEIIEDGKDGYLFDYNDIDRLAEMLCNLVENRDNIKKMLTIFEQKLQRFDINSMVSRYIDLYGRLTQGR